MSTYANDFYERLQKVFDTSDELNMDVPNASLVYKPTPANTINTSGNIKLSVNIPLTNDKAPNYSETLMNSNLKQAGCLKLIFDAIKSATFTATCPSDNLAAENPTVNAYDGRFKYETNNVENLNEMLEKNKDNPLHAWNLNFNRNLDIEKVKAITAHLLNKINEIIDYVITNDLKDPDAKFRQMIKELFANGDNVYNFAHYTLMLPALVNYLASKGANAKTAHATRYMGIVKKDSGLFPKKGTLTFDQEDKWHKSGDPLNANNVCPYAIFNNNDCKLKIGAFNYPFSQQNYNIKFRPNTANVNTSSTDPVLKNIPIGFKSDPYVYKDPINNQVGETIKNLDGTDRNVPTAVYGSRDIDWNTEFSKHWSRTPYSIRFGGIGQQNFADSWKE